MKSWRKILWPLGVGYDAITRVRNYLYKINALKTTQFFLPVIGVGNLSVGGTGKTPMVEYITKLLNHKQVAILSRGYGRRTNGFKLVHPKNTASEVGDEPLQFAKKFPKVSVAVDEKRVHGVERLLNINSDIETIILDDVYQHRAITPGFLILLTSFDAVFTKDLVLPAGNLRESRSGAQRATCVVVTKCPKDLSIYKRQEIQKAIRKYTLAPLYFSYIAYDRVIKSEQNTKDLLSLKNISFTLVTGIAKASPLVKFLKEMELNFEHIAFKDHHEFTEDEVKRLNTKSLILTTEKDYVRLVPSIETGLYYIPIKNEFIDNGKEFDQAIVEYVDALR